MSGLEHDFQRYFEAMERSGGDDRCFVCRRGPAEVKAFFGFDEDGVPLDAAAFGLEDVVLGETDIMSYLGTRPVCAVCQLNVDTLTMLQEHHVLLEVLREMREERGRLWPRS